MRQRKKEYKDNQKALLAQAARGKRKIIQRALERNSDIMESRKLRDEVNKQIEERHALLDKNKLNNYRSEYDRIESEMSRFDRNDPERSRLKLRAEQLEKLAAMIIERKPNPIFRKVKMPENVDFSGTPTYSTVYTGQAI